MAKHATTAEPKAPATLRVKAGYATQAEVAATRVVSEPTLRKVESGEPGVNTGTLDDLADLYGEPREVMYAAYALVRGQWRAA